MKAELQQKLFKKYPKIFRQKKLSMTETCMYWGIECPNSWYKILNNLCSKIQKYIDAGNIEQIEATQVKEKYGTLRFYSNNYDPIIDDLIDKAEIETSKICAYCGSKDDVKGSENGWILYLCQLCRNKKCIL